MFKILWELIYTLYTRHEVLFFKIGLKNKGTGREGTNMSKIIINKFNKTLFLVQFSCLAYNYTNYHITLKYRHNHIHQIYLFVLKDGLRVLSLWQHFNMLNTYIAPFYDSFIIHTEISTRYYCDRKHHRGLALAILSLGHWSVKRRSRTQTTMWYQ